MKFLRISMEGQFRPSPGGGDTSMVPGGHPAPVDPARGAGMTVVSSQHVRDFDIREHIGAAQPASFGSVESPWMRPEEPQERKIVPVLDYRDEPRRSQTSLLWTGPHWQVEKLLMDIGLAAQEPDGDCVVLNDGQDGVIREVVSAETGAVVSLRYNYPHQARGEPSTVLFSCVRPGDTSRIRLTFSGFAVILSSPVNPQLLGANYLRRVLLHGGEFVFED